MVAAGVDMRLGLGGKVVDASGASCGLRPQYRSAHFLGSLPWLSIADGTLPPTSARSYCSSEGIDGRSGTIADKRYPSFPYPPGASWRALSGPPAW